jgi:hypothetical protein
MSKIGDQGSGIGDREDHLDLAIDRAVREMLDVEPPPGLRGRVLDGIELSSNSVVSTVRRKVFWIAAPTFAAATIVLAVLAPWRTAPRVMPARPTIARVQPPPVVVPPPPSPKIAEPSRQPTTRTIPPPAARQPASRGIDEGFIVATVALDEDADTVIDPLAPIAPIVAAGTHPAGIAPKENAISPMAPIAQLHIPPFSPPERRN